MQSVTAVREQVHKILGECRGPFVAKISFLFVNSLSRSEDIRT